MRLDLFHELFVVAAIHKMMVARERFFSIFFVLKLNQQASHNEAQANQSQSRWTRVNGLRERNYDKRIGRTAEILKTC